MAYAGFKDLTRRTPAGKYYVLGIKVLCDEAFNIAKNTKYEEYQRGLSSMVYKFLDKKNSGGTVTKENISNKELKAIEIQKIIIGKFEKRKVHSSFIDNIWGADLAIMQLISKCNKGFIYSLCVIDIYKYAWVIRLNDKRGIAISNAFQITLDESNCKSNKI